MILVIFDPKMKKKEKENIIYSTVDKVNFLFFLVCGLAGQLASPRCWSARTVGHVEQVNAD